MARIEDPSNTGTENLGLAMSLEPRIQSKDFDQFFAWLSIMLKRACRCRLNEDCWKSTMLI